ncbi:MAG: FemAB family PEP-CTERM system-associated protein [Spongiibacteraceae bacterium]
MSETEFTLKTILANPRQACELRWPQAGDLDTRCNAVSALIDAINALKPALKNKKNEKQECARDFGRIKNQGGDIEAQKALMQRIASELDSIEQKLRELEAQLLNLFAPDEVARKPFPPRFDSRADIAASLAHIIAIDDSEQAAWDAYVDGHLQASLYHTYRWRTVIEQSFGHECFYLAAKDDQQKICGVLPLMRLRSRLFGDFAISVPFFNYGGPLADNAQISAQLLAHAAEIAKNLHLKHLEIRATHSLNADPTTKAWPARTDKASMIRRLPRTSEQLDEEIGAKVRAQIKRARQEDIEIRAGQLELLDDFYRVFAINMRDLGTPVYGKNFFRNILTAFPQQAHIVSVRLRGKPVAAAFLLGHRDMMEIPWASTLRSVNALNMNMLLYRAVLGFTIEQGYPFFDFGRSTIDSGTYRFKRQWGAQPLQHYWHYWQPNDAELPALKPDSPKFKLMIAAWQQLPVAISKLIGPHIVKYLP